MILIVNSFLLSFIYETILVDMTTSKVGAVPSHGDHGASSYLATCATVLNAEHFAHAARKLGFNATDLMLHKFIDLHSLWWNVGRWWSFVCQPRHSYGMSNRKENQFKKEVEHRKSWFFVPSNNFSGTTAMWLFAHRPLASWSPMNSTLRISHLETSTQSPENDG